MATYRMKWVVREVFSRILNVFRMRNIQNSAPGPTNLAGPVDYREF
jgi:hypothetical protein